MNIVSMFARQRSTLQGTAHDKNVVHAAVTPVTAPPADADADAKTTQGAPKQGEQTGITAPKSAILITFTSAEGSKGHKASAVHVTSVDGAGLLQPVLITNLSKVQLNAANGYTGDPLVGDLNMEASVTIKKGVASVLEFMSKCLDRASRLTAYWIDLPTANLQIAFLIAAAKVLLFVSSAVR